MGLRDLTSGIRLLYEIDICIQGADARPKRSVYLKVSLVVFISPSDPSTNWIEPAAARQQPRPIIDRQQVQFGRHHRALCGKTFDLVKIGSTQCPWAIRDELLQQMIDAQIPDALSTIWFSGVPLRQKSFLATGVGDLAGLGVPCVSHRSNVVIQDGLIVADPFSISQVQ